MAKIIAKADLTLGTNLILHIADKGGTDIAIDATSGEISSSSTDFTATSTNAGITNRPLVAGDQITLSHTALAGNEGVVLSCDSVAANLIEFSIVSGVPVDEVAGNDINLVAFKKTYEFLEAGALDFIDGVQGIVLASEMIDLWDASDLDKYDRAFTSIEPRAKSIASVNGWEPHNSDTLNAIRDTALEVRDTVTASARQIYGLFRSNNLHESSDQMNFWPVGQTQMDAPAQAVMTGYINQLFLIYDYNGGSPVDDRGVWFTRCAEAGKSIVMEQHAVNYAEIMPVSAANDVDPKLGDAGGAYVSDATILAGGAYANIDYNSDIDGVYEGDVNGADFNFDGFIECDAQTNVLVHEKVNWLLRQATNINEDGTGDEMRGDKQWPLTTFSGDVFTLKTYPLNYNPAERNNLRAVDNTDATRQWPTILTLTIEADALAVGGTFSIYHEDTFGTSAAIFVQDENDVDQSDIAITASRGIVVAYSTYNVDGHTSNTPINCRMAYNRPGLIEADNISFTLDGSNKTVKITPVADPSYIA